VCGCSSTGGWTRVANLNMSNPSELCPSEWILQTYSSEPSRLCGGVSSGTGCASAMYSTYGINYSQVCGRVIGYQYRAPDAFSPAIENPSVTIDGNYVDGVSVTHGASGGRQHVWTFAAGFLETVRPAHQNQIPHVYCPCVNESVTPSFVGNDYFCESGNPGPEFPNILHASDPLWDGQGCGSPPCCELTSTPGVTTPWFCKQLPQITNDDIEVRICRNEHS